MCEMSPSTAAQMHMHVWKIGALPKRLSDDVAEVWTPPGPIVVLYDVGGAGIQRSVVSVELTRLVRRISTLPCEVTLEKLNIRLL